MLAYASSRWSYACRRLVTLFVLTLWVDLSLVYFQREELVGRGWKQRVKGMGRQHERTLGHMLPCVRGSSIRYQLVLVFVSARWWSVDRGRVLLLRPFSFALGYGCMGRGWERMVCVALAATPAMFVTWVG